MNSFDENKVYASCHNKGGSFALPCGELYLVYNDGQRKCVAFSDYVDGAFLNDVIEKQNTTLDNISKVIFKHPIYENSLEEVLYERD